MKERLKTIDTAINLDWEHEFAKDFVYLYEQEQQLDEEIQKEMNKRLPAKITVIDKDKILDKQHEHQHHPLPF